MFLNVISHSDANNLYTKIPLCEYCEGTVLNCHCLFFKELNDGTIPFTENVEKELQEIECQMINTPKSLGKQLKNRLQFLIYSLKFNWDFVPFRERLNHSKIVTKKVYRSDNVINHFLAEMSPYEDIVTRCGTKLNLHLLVIHNIYNIFIESRNFFLESVFGTYCPVYFRNNKLIDYDGLSYKTQQKTLAQTKMLEQEKQLKAKRMYNPSNKNVFWAIRLLNFEKEYSYSKVCNMALQHQNPWVRYHEGLNIFPRKHILRRWLNKRWQWETIIDYIFKELGPCCHFLENCSNEENLLERQVTTNNSDTVFQAQGVLETASPLDYDIFEEAFQKLVYICNTDIPKESKPLNNFSIRTI